MLRHDVLIVDGKNVSWKEWIWFFESAGHDGHIQLEGRRNTGLERDALHVVKRAKKTAEKEHVRNTVDKRELESIDMMPRVREKTKGRRSEQCEA